MENINTNTKTTTASCSIKNSNLLNDRKFIKTHTRQPKARSQSMLTKLLVCSVLIACLGLIFSPLLAIAGGKGDKGEGNIIISTGGGGHSHKVKIIKVSTILTFNYDNIKE